MGGRRPAAGRRAGRVLGALLVVAAVLVPGSWAAAGVPAATAPTADGKPAPAASDGTATYEDLAGCLSTTGRLLVVLLVDESGSLQATDPAAVRVAAAKTALSGLTGLTGSGGGTAKVDVLVSAFSNRFKPVGTWRALTKSTLPGLRTTVDGLAARNTGMDTDFANALTGAREALAEEAVTVGEQSASVCKAILLFTDGRYDLGVRTNEAQRKKYGDTKPYAPGQLLIDEATVARVEKLGRGALCDANGIVDQVRGDDIVTLTVALTTQLRPADQEFLRAVTLGKAGDQTCGRRNGSSKGVFLPASDLESLIGTFDAVATRVAGGSPLGSASEPTACADGKACAAGRTEFVVDPSVRRVHLFVKVPTAKTQIVIEAPKSGGPLELADRVTASPEFKGGTVQVAWPSPKAATIDILPADAAAGRWTVTLVEPGKAPKGRGSVQVYLFTDFVARLTSTPAVTVGDATTLRANVVSLRSGAKVTTLRSAEIEAVLTDPITGRAARVTLAAKGKGYAGTYAAPASLTTSVLRVVLRLAAVTKDGVDVSSLSPQVSLATRKPDGYPFVGPAELVLSPVTGAGVAEGELQVFGSGPKLPPGCVWLGGATLSAKPEGIDTVEVGSKGAGRTAGDCLTAPSTGSTPITLRFKPSHRGSGSVRGAVRIWTQKKGDKALPTDIPFSFEMTRGIDKTKQLALFVALLALGLGLPLALLFAMNRISTRFQAMQYVQGANVPVIIRRSGEILRTNLSDQLDQIHLYGYDFSAIPASESPRHFTWAGLDFAAKAPANPFAESFATASPEGGNTDVAREGRKVNLALSLAGSWMFLYDPDATDAATQRITGSLGRGEPPEIHGRLVAFIAKGAVPPQVERMLLDIMTGLPRTARRMSELAQAARKS